MIGVNIFINTIKEDLTMFSKKDLIHAIEEKYSDNDFFIKPPTSYRPSHLLKSRLLDHIKLVQTWIAQEDAKIATYLTAYDINTAVSLFYIYTRKIREAHDSIDKKPEFAQEYKTKIRSLQNNAVHCYHDWLKDKKCDDKIIAEMLNSFKRILAIHIHLAESSNDKTILPNSSDFSTSKKINYEKVLDQLTALDSQCHAFTPEFYKQLFTLEYNEKLLGVNHYDTSGLTAVHHACLAGNLQLIQELIDLRCDLKLPTRAGISCADLVLENDKYIALELIQLFVKDKQQAEQKNQRGDALLHSAILHDNILIIKWLHESFQININSITNDKLSALHLAVLHGHKHIVDYLLSIYIDETILNREGHSALGMAIMADNIEIQKIFLARNIYLNREEEDRLIRVMHAQATKDSTQSANIKKYYKNKLFRKNSYVTKLNDDGNRLNYPKIIVHESKQAIPTLFTENTMEPMEFIKSNYVINELDRHKFTLEEVQQGLKALKYPNDEVAAADYVNKIFSSAKNQALSLNDLHNLMKNQFENYNRSQHESLINVMRSLIFCKLTNKEKNNLLYFNIFNSLQENIIKEMEFKKVISDDRFNWTSRLDKNRFQIMISHRELLIRSEKNGDHLFRVCCKIHISNNKVVEQQIFIVCHQSLGKNIIPVLKKFDFIPLDRSIEQLQIQALSEYILNKIKTTQNYKQKQILSKLFDEIENDQYAEDFALNCPSYLLIKALDISLYKIPQVSFYANLAHYLRQIKSGKAPFTHIMKYLADALSFINYNMKKLNRYNDFRNGLNLLFNNVSHDEYNALAVSFSKPLTEIIDIPYIKAIISHCLTKLLQPIDANDAADLAMREMTPIIQQMIKYNDNDIESSPLKYSSINTVMKQRLETIINHLPQLLITLALPDILSGTHADRLTIFKPLCTLPSLRNQLSKDLLRQLNLNYRNHEFIFQVMAEHDLFFASPLMNQLGIFISSHGLSVKNTIIKIKDYKECEKVLQRLYLGWIAIQYIDKISYDNEIQAAIFGFKKLLGEIPHDFNHSSQALWHKIRLRCNQRMPKIDTDKRHPDERFIGQLFDLLGKLWASKIEQNDQINYALYHETIILKSIFDLHDVFVHFATLLTRLMTMQAEFKGNIEFFKLVAFFPLSELVITCRRLLDKQNPLIYDISMKLLGIAETIVSLLNEDYAAIHSALFNSNQYYNDLIATQTKDTLKALIENDRSLLFATDLSGNTLLHTACELSRDDLVKMLLERGALTETYNKPGKTALVIAIEKNNQLNVNHLLLSGANPSQQDENLKNTLHIALDHKNDEAAKILATHSQDLLGNLDREWKKPSDYANSSELKAFFNDFKDKKEKPSEHFYYQEQLNQNKNIIAAKILFLEGCKGSVSEFIKLDTQYNFVNNGIRDQNGFTALLSSAYNGYFDIVKCILAKYPESIHDRSYYQQDVIMVAAQKAHFQIVEYLLIHFSKELSGNVDYQFSNAAHFAAFGGSLPILKLLHAHRYNFNDTSSLNLTPLDVALNTRNLAWTARSNIVAFLFYKTNQSTMKYIVSMLAIAGLSFDDINSIAFEKSFSLLFQNIKTFKKIVDILSDNAFDARLNNIHKIYLNQYKDFATLYKLGNWYLFYKKYDDAILQFESAKEFQPKNADLMNKLGLAYYFNNEFLKAQTCFNLACRYDPRNLFYLDNYRTTLADAGKCNEIICSKENFNEFTATQKKIEMQQETIFQLENEILALEDSPKTAMHVKWLADTDELICEKIDKALTINPLYELGLASKIDVFNNLGKNALEIIQQHFLLNPTENFLDFLCLTAENYLKLAIQSKNRFDAKRALNCLDFILQTEKSLDQDTQQFVSDTLLILHNEFPEMQASSTLPKKQAPHSNMPILFKPSKNKADEIKENKNESKLTYST